MSESNARVSPVALRPHQARGSVAIDAAFAAGHRAVVVVAPTGGGKGTLAAHKLREAELRGERAIFIVHRAEIVADIYDRVLRTGSTQVGRIWGRDQKRDVGARIQVATVDSLDEDRMPNADLVVIDEAHRVMGARYRRVLQRYVDAGARVLLLTATPIRLDGQGLRDVATEMIILATPSELIAAGVIVAPLVYSGRVDTMPDLTGVRERAGEFSANDLADRVNKTHIIGGIVDRWFEKTYDYPTVCFAVNIAHSEALAAAFAARGVAAEHVDGTMSDHARGMILDRFTAGETRVVSQCNLLCEGFDHPAIKCIVWARPTKSLTVYLQGSGRALRPWNDITPIILDHAWNGRRFNYPTLDRPFSLQVTDRRTSLPEDAPRRTCPQCGVDAPLGAKTCPGCGFVFGTTTRVIDEIEAELELLRPTDDEGRDAPAAAAVPEAPMLTVPLPPTDREKRAALDGWRKLAARRNQPAAWVAERYTNAYGEPLQALVERERAALDARAAREAAARALPPPASPADDGPLEDLDV